MYFYPINIDMNYDAVAHSQIHSKLWLCEIIEPYIPKKSTVCILGSWINILGTMMLYRNHQKYTSITGIDIDPIAIEEADKFTSAWQIQPNCQLRNINADANSFNYLGYDIIINCSVEHMENNNWFNLVNDSSLLCIQSSNILTDDKIWDIKHHCPDLESLQKKFPLRNTIYTGEMSFDYDNLSFKRFMIIGNR